MKKKEFVLLEIAITLIFFSSWLIWNIVMKNYTFSEAFASSTDITFIVFILMNLFIAFGYEKNSDKQ